LGRVVLVEKLKWRMGRPPGGGTGGLGFRKKNVQTVRWGVKGDHVRARIAGGRARSEMLCQCAGGEGGTMGQIADAGRMHFKPMEGGFLQNVTETIQVAKNPTRKNRLPLAWPVRKRT